MHKVIVMSHASMSRPSFSEENEKPVELMVDVQNYEVKELSELGDLFKKQLPRLLASGQVSSVSVRIDDLVMSFREPGEPRGFITGIEFAKNYLSKLF